MDFLHRLNSNTFVHLGLSNGLKKKLTSSDKIEKLVLQFNIDGLPLWRSSRIEFLPILSRISNARDKSELMVSLHCAVGKPKNLNAYLTPLLRELEQYLSFGLNHRGRNFAVRIGAFCCDAPARAFVKQIIGHG